jgi:hypothetical protein
MPPVATSRKPAAPEPSPASTDDNQEGADDTGDNKDLSAMMREMMERVTLQSKLIGRLESDVRNMKKSSEKPADEKPEDKTLSERVKRQEELNQKMRQRAIRQAIASALQAEGVTDISLATKHARYLEREFDGRLSVSDDLDIVTIEDNGVAVPINRHINAFLKSDDGKWLVPAKTPPNDRGAAKGPGPITVGSDGRMRITQETYIRLATQGSPAERQKIAKGEFELVDAGQES